MQSSGEPPPVPPRAEPGAESGFTAGRIVAVVLGVVSLIIGLSLAAAAATVLWADQTQRDSDGFLSTGTDRLSTPSHALRFETVDLQDAGAAAVAARWLSGAQIRVTSGTGAPVFVGIAPTEEVDRYLDGVAYDRVIELPATGPDRYLPNPGERSPEPPETQQIWVASSAGTGEQVLSWQPETGRWALVVMNADGSPVVLADMSAAVRAPILTGLGFGLALVSAVLLIGGTLLVFFGLRHQVRPAPAQQDTSR